MNKMSRVLRWCILLVMVSFLLLISVYAVEEKKETQKEDQVVAEFDGGKVMQSEIGERMMRMGGLTEADLGAPEKESIIKEIALSKILHTKGVKEGLKDVEEFKQQKEKWDQRELGKLLYEEVILSKASLNDDEIKKYYDEHPDEFKQDLSFTMRHIFLSTYKEYKVQKGDTLYEIAKTVSGDSEVAKKILDKDKNEIDLKKKIKTGAILYVPMNKEEKLAVKKKMDEVKAKLDAGGDFVKLAKEYSESDASKKGETIGPLPVPNAPKPLLNEIKEAAMKTEVGKYTDIIETKHGYQIIKIENKVMPGMKTFESVKTVIDNKIKRDKQRKLEEEYIDKLLTGPNVTSNFDVLKKEDIKEDEVLFKIGDFVYTKKNFDGDIEALSPRIKSQLTTPDDKIKFAKNQLLQRAIVADAKEKKLNEKDSYKQDYDKFEVNVISNMMVKKLVDDNVKVEEPELKTNYEKNKDRYKNPKRVDIDIIAKKLTFEPNMSDEAKKAEENKVSAKLKELREKIVKGEAKYADVAEKESEDSSSKDKGKLGLINPLIKGQEFKGAVDKMKVGEMSEPIKYGNNMAIVKLNKVEEERLKPFDEVKGMVENAVKMEKRAALKKELDEKFLKEHNFKILISLEEKSEKEEKALEEKSPKEEKK